MLLRYPKELAVWQLGSAVKGAANQLTANALLKLSQEPVRLLQLKAKEDEWIMCAGISNRGDYLAYATESSLYVYHFAQSGGELKLQKLALPEEVIEATYHRMIFLTDGRLLLATANLTLQLLSVSASSGVKLIHTFSKEVDKQFSPEDSIHLMNSSADGHFVVVGDHKSNIIVLDMRSLKVHAVLPRYQSHPTALAFHPSSKLLVVAYSNHKVKFYFPEEFSA